MIPPPSLNVFLIFWDGITNLIDNDKPSYQETIRWIENLTTIRPPLHIQAFGGESNLATKHRNPCCISFSYLSGNMIRLFCCLCRCRIRFDSFR
jgi:hypothetical protein